MVPPNTFDKALPGSRTYGSKSYLNCLNVGDQMFKLFGVMKSLWKPPMNPFVKTLRKKFGIPEIMCLDIAWPNLAK